MNFLGYYDKIEQSIANGVKRLKNWISKLKTFWYYYKNHTIIAILAIIVFVPMIWDLATRLEPDYSVAIISQSYYTQEQLDKLKEVLTQNAGDPNGDGHVLVDVMYYQVDVNEPYRNDTGISALQGNITAGMSGFFLMDDALSFQSATGLLAYQDGHIPEEPGLDIENMVIPVSQVSKLRGLGFDDLDLGLRMDHEYCQAYREMLEALKN